MKKISIIISIFALAGLLSLQSCDKDTGADGFDFSNSLPPYVALSSTAGRTISQDTTISFSFVMRTGLQQAVTVTYNVSGAVNLMNQTAVIDRNKTSVAVNVKFPDNLVVPPATSTTATLTLVKAVTADGKELTIGQKNTPATEKVTIKINP